MCTVEFFIPLYIVRGNNLYRGIILPNLHIVHWGATPLMTLSWSALHISTRSLFIMVVQQLKHFWSSFQPGLASPRPPPTNESFLFSSPGDLLCLPVFLTFSIKEVNVTFCLVLAEPRFWLAPTLMSSTLMTPHWWALRDLFSSSEGPQLRSTSRLPNH